MKRLYSRTCTCLRGEEYTTLWNKKEIHKQLFDRSSAQLGHKHMDDWYNVTQEDIYKCGGRGILNSYYNGSSSKALQSLYPEHKWRLWRFGGTVPKGYWENSEHRRAFFDWSAT